MDTFDNKRSRKWENLDESTIHKKHLTRKTELSTGFRYSILIKVGNVKMKKAMAFAYLWLHFAYLNQST
jgi:hypothetical protein